MGSSSMSPYRDETHGMAAQCERLEEEVRTLRRSVRKLSAKTSLCSVCARRRHPRRAVTPDIAKFVVFLLTLMLTLSCVGYPRQTRACGSRTPREKDTGFEATLLAFSGFR